MGDDTENTAIIPLNCGSVVFNETAGFVCEAKRGVPPFAEESFQFSGWKPGPDVHSSAMCNNALT